MPPPVPPPEVPDWKRYGYASYEAWIEYHAGDCPRDWPMPPIPEWSEENQATPEEA